MAQLYRKAALERISFPEQLDKVLVISSPLSWQALIGITLMIAAAVIWSVLGTIPMTVTVQGMIVPAVSTNAVYADSPGTVTAVLVRPGDAIAPGKPVLQYERRTEPRPSLCRTRPAWSAMCWPSRERR